MDTFESLVKWLHAAAPSGYTPQLGIADANKIALCWLPGRARKPSGVTVDGARVKFLGCTNRAYPSPYEPMDSQPSVVTFAALDIDWEDQEPGRFRTREALARAVLDAITDELGAAGSLRWSCGGRGLHVIFRLSSAVPVSAHPIRGAHTAITRHILRPWKKAVEAAGVHICKDDSRMFWLWGGKNEWVGFPTERLLTVDPRLCADVGSHDALRPPDAENLGSSGARSGGYPAWIDSDPFVRGWLDKLQTKPGLVYVGTIVHRLRAMGEEVTTRSGCSGNGVANGYVDVQPGRVSLWTYADGATIWAAEDVERTLAAMGFSEEVNNEEDPA